MSIAAKFSLRNLILARWSEFGLKTNLSCFIDEASDTKLPATCPFVGIYQLPDLPSGRSGHGFDPFVIRYFYSGAEMDAEVAFGKMLELFKAGIEGAEYTHGTITYLDDFEYVDGSENKAGRQTTGSKLPYKQFTVYAPKTNIV